MAFTALPLPASSGQRGWAVRLAVCAGHAGSAAPVGRIPTESGATRWAVLDRGGAFTPEGIQAVWDLNASFVEKNISPGGCADLLILAIFLEKMEGLGPADR